MRLYFCLLLLFTIVYSQGCTDSTSCFGQTCCLDAYDDVGYCCLNTTSSCCYGVCCETNSTQCCSNYYTGSSCISPNSTCCPYYDEYSIRSCSNNRECCGSKCCDVGQLCLNSYDGSCCAASTDYYVHACGINNECGTGYSCCDGCCCPSSNYTCTSNGCVFDLRKTTYATGMGIGLGYGLGLGFLVLSSLCCIHKGILRSRRVKGVGIFSLLQMSLTFVRIGLYGGYPYLKSFEWGVAGCVTSFWLHFVGLLLWAARWRRLRGWFAILWIVACGCNFYAFYIDFHHPESTPYYRPIMGFNLLTFIVDGIVLVYIYLSTIIKKCCPNIYNYSPPWSKANQEGRRNKIEFVDYFKPSPKLSSVSDATDDWKNITQHFLDSWVKGEKNNVRFIQILKIDNPGVKSNFRSYKKRITKLNDGNPNVRRFFHATKLSDQCPIMNHRKLCKNADCSVCGIVRQGFRIVHSGLNIKFSRFGRGVYFAPNSSKANDYTADDVRAILYCKVVCGNEWETQEDQQDLTEPPYGYHCVCGMPGTRLNYPEVVVYNGHATKPTHVIFYSYTE